MGIIRYGKIGRITVDLDTRDIDALIHCLEVFKKYGFTKNLKIKKSPGGKGFHVIAFHESDGVPFNMLLKIRAEAGDDPMRILCDSLDDRMIQVLFTNKSKRIVKVGELFRKYVTNK